MGFSGYFSIVADFIQWAKDNQIPVGPGRGSGAGSLVAYALKITDIDPAIGPGALLTEITNQQFFYDENEKLKEIKIIKPNLIERVSSDYKKALRS